MILTKFRQILTTFHSFPLRKWRWTLKIHLCQNWRFSRFWEAIAEQPFKLQQSYLADLLPGKVCAFCFYSTKIDQSVSEIFKHKLRRSFSCEKRVWNRGFSWLWPAMAEQAFELGQSFWGRMLASRNMYRVFSLHQNRSNGFVNIQAQNHLIVRSVYETNFLYLQ